MSELAPRALISLEIVLVLAGCVLLWRKGLSPAARAAHRARATAMPAWPVTVPSFLLFLWLVVCGGLLLQSFTALALKSFPVDATAGLIIAGGAFQIGMLLGALGYKRFWERDAARPGRALPGRKLLRDGFVTVTIALPVLAATGLIWQTVLQLGGIELEAQDLVGIFAETESMPLLAFMILLATVVAPVTEELLFRGGLYRYARTRFPRWVALLVPSLLFASLHGNLASFAPLVALGVILSLAYERTGNIMVPIIAHGLFNLNTILLILAGVGL